MKKTISIAIDENLNEKLNSLVSNKSSFLEYLIRRELS